MKPPRKLHIKSYGCQMNVYDAQRMADTLARRGLCRDRNRGRRGSGDPQHLPHPREGFRKGLFRARAAARAQGRSRPEWPADQHRGGRLRGAGRRQRDHRPGARGRRRGRAAKLPPSAANCWRARKATAARWRPNFRSGQVRISAAAAARGDSRARNFVVRDRAGRLRQVLYLLRGALYARRRSVAAGGENRRRRATSCRSRRARDHPDRPERQRLSRRRTRRADLVARHPAASPRRNSGHRPLALLHQPSPRRRRNADRGAPRSCRADAVRAPAGPIRLRPDSRRHEPPAYRR